MKSKLKSIVLLAVLSWGGLTAQTYDYPFRNPDLPLDVRVQDIISRLTLEEKVQLMKHAAPAVPRLGIPAYNWWNEALHGVARTKEKVTVFPQAIGCHLRHGSFAEDGGYDLFGRTRPVQ